MNEATAAPEIKTSNRPEIQAQVDQQKQTLETKYPNENPGIINHWARDKVASILSKDRLKKESAIDELTTLLSAKAYKAEKNRILETTNRDTNAPTVQGIRFDLDEFGRINKLFGQDTGDEVLKKIGLSVNDTTRSSDTIGRIGGEEFEVSAPRTTNPDRKPGDKPIPLSKKLQEAISTTEFSHDIKMSASFGVTEYKKGETIEEYNKRLENAQVAAKRLGRNRVVEARTDGGSYIYIDHSTGKKYSVERDENDKILDPKELSNG